MTKSFKRNLTVTVTPKEGAAFTLTGAEAASFYAAYERGEGRINVITDDGNTRTIYTQECVCSVEGKFAKGEEYKKPEAENLFCDPAPVSEE